MYDTPQRSEVVPMGLPEALLMFAVWATIETIGFILFLAIFMVTEPLHWFTTLKGKVTALLRS